MRKEKETWAIMSLVRDKMRVQQIKYLYVKYLYVNTTKYHSAILS